MRKFGAALNGVDNNHRQEGYVGKVSSSGGGGKNVNVSNASNSQIKAVSATPYGISSTPPSGMMAFVLVGQGADRDGVVGVYDPNKPSCGVGCCMMYSAGGATVKCSGKSVLLNNRNVLGEIDAINKDIEDINKEIEEIKKKI